MRAEADSTGVTATPVALAVTDGAATSLDVDLTTDSTTAPVVGSATLIGGEAVTTSGAGTGTVIGAETRCAGGATDECRPAGGAPLCVLDVAALTRELIDLSCSTAFGVLFEVEAFFTNLWSFLSSKACFPLDVVMGGCSW